MANSRSNALKLFSLGFLTLFLELVLIRYLAGNIWNLGYFPNLVLLGVFVGMGIGFVFHHYIPDSDSGRYFNLSSVVVAILVAFVTFMHPSLPGFGLSAGNIGGDLYFTASPQRSNIVTPFGFILWFFSVVLIFAMIAQRTAKVFRFFSPLKAYTLDISGSCAGIVAFMAMSWFQLPGYVWFLCVIPLFAASMDQLNFRKQFLVPAISLLAVVGLAKFQDGHLLASFSFDQPVDVRWSPYQKIEYVNTDKLPYQVFVNGIAHQAMEAPEKLSRLDGIIRYSMPYVERAKNPQLPPYKRVLVLGAGSGNDVATALMNGVEHVDAVEIDPVIAQLGRDYHPAHPYRDPRVQVTIDDGRAFMTRSQEKYDLIIFALTDSLVKVSPMAQLRLENYLFTEDSVRKAHSLLTENGDLLFYNFYRRPWLLQKLEQMVFNVSGQYPRRLYQVHDFAMLAAGKNNVAETAPQWTTPVDVPVDDWPFLYLEKRGMPWIYLLSMSALIAIMLWMMSYLHKKAIRKFSPEERSGGLALPTKLAFVSMGVAFLLLETKSIIQFSLLFGTTWINNSLVFLAVLLLVLAANWAAVLIKGAKAIWVIYGLLVASCLLTFVFPLAGLLQLESVTARFVLASLMTFSPLFFANLIFSVTFRDQKVPEHIFGWNLIGATLGGVIEYLSMVMGYSALAIIVALCYTLTVIFLVWGRKNSEVSANVNASSSPVSV